jgi:hypothetical protein
MRNNHEVQYTAGAVLLTRVPQRLGRWWRFPLTRESVILSGT